MVLCLIPVLKQRVMTHITCEMMWLKSLLWELRFSVDGPMPMYCDNKDAIYITSNHVFHERTKHIEVDCHFCSWCGLSKVDLYFIHFIFWGAHRYVTKPIPPKVFSHLCNNLSMIDIYTSAWERVFNSLIS